jgi:hypothetical protein
VLCILTVSKVVSPAEWNATKSYSDIAVMIPAPLMQCVIANGPGRYQQSNRLLSPMHLKQFEALAISKKYVHTFGFITAIFDRKDVKNFNSEQGQKINSLFHCKSVIYENK